MLRAVRAFTWQQAPREVDDEAGELERLRAVFEVSPEAIFVIDPVHQRLVDVNREACHVLGYSRNALLSARLERIFPQWDLREDNSARLLPMRMQIRCRDSVELMVECHVRATEPERKPLLVVFARRLLAEAATKCAEQAGPLLLTDLGHDPLTRLPNRRLFENRLQWMMKMALRRRNYTFGVLFVDLDGFKAVNDRFGHAQGDELLAEVARRLSRSVRPGDCVSRIGGDEFTVLVANLRRDDDAVRVARRIEDALASPVRLGEEDVRITASIGIAHSSEGYVRADAIVRDADRAMYRAKALGKSHYVCCGPDDLDCPASRA